MIDPSLIVARVLDFHPSAYASGQRVFATLQQRVNAGSTDTYSSTVWSALEQPTDKARQMGMVADSTEVTTFQLLKETQSTEPRVEDRLVILGGTWVIRNIHANIQRFAFDCACTKAES